MINLTNDKCPVCGKELKPFINDENHVYGIIVRAYCCEENYFAVLPWNAFVNIPKKIQDDFWEKLAKGK